MTLPMNWAYQTGQAPTSSAIFKATPEDFIVDEILGFEPEADEKGQHHWLYVKKRDANTDFVARQLAAHANIHPKLVSFSGQKDRQGVTQQWFSVELPAKQDIDWQTFQHPDITVVKHVRSGRKLRRGTHQANRFIIRLRDVTAADAVEARLAQIQQHGVPNYFGEQRFGRDGGNLEKAQAMFAGKRFKDRNLRSLVLSSARSWLFNQVVSARVEQGLQHRVLLGDVFVLSGSHSFFTWQEEQSRSTIEQRLSDGDIELSAPMWGRGETSSEAEAKDFELSALQTYGEFKAGLEAAGLKQERRALLLKPQALTWQWQGADLELSFSLQTGTFATSLLRELVVIRD